MNWIKYSGINITLKVNPLHWRISCAYKETNDVWTQDAFVLELLMFTVRVWISDGSW